MKNPSGPLAGLLEQIEQARHIPAASPLFLPEQDPLQLMSRRVQGARVRSAPPLLGVELGIEQARELARALPLLEAPDDPLGLWVEKPQEVSLAQPPSAAPSGMEQGQPEAAPEPASSASASDEMQISSLLLDALATRPLSGDARASAASALARGIAHGDEGALRAALAILVTGE